MNAMRIAVPLSALRVVVTYNVTPRPRALPPALVESVPSSATQVQCATSAALVGSVSNNAIQAQTALSRALAATA